MFKNIFGTTVVLSILLTSSIFASGFTTGKIPTQNRPTPTVDTQKNTIKWLVILNDYFARDEKNVYGLNDEKNGWTIIDIADRETFKVILGRFAQDKNTIFSLRQKLENVDRKSFVVISGAHGYASDDDTVYWPQGIILGADPETFKLYTGKYGADSGHVYYMWKEIAADSATFQVLDNWSYALDATKVFYNGKELQGIPVEGFAVKGERAFASDGHVFFEWRVEKWDPLPVDEEDPVDTVDPVDPEIGEPVEIPSQTLAQKLFAENGILTPYKILLNIEWPFLAFLVVVIIGIFSALFVFFAERNDETASWMKTFFKTIIALIVGGAVFWLLTYWLSLLVSGLIGGLIGAVAFLSLSDLGGKIKTIFVTLLACIAFGFFVSIAVIVLRTMNTTPQAVLEYITQDTFQMIAILGSIGVFIGSWLIKTQLKTSTAGAVSGALIATLFSLLILVFVYWLWPIVPVMATLLFSLLFGAFVWVLSFRLNQTLLLTSVRVLRMMILLGMLCFIVVWFIV